MHVNLVIAAALLQAEGGGDPLKTLGFILVIVFGGAAFWLLFLAEDKMALGAVCAVIAFIILWNMAGLPLPNINKRIFNGDGAAVPFHPALGMITNLMLVGL